ncbi:MAG: radical SAM protein [Candidatus Heimdallarchaeota archaeon]
MNKELRPIAIVNITNRCTLKCKHCFVYRKDTPHTLTKKNEMPADQMINELKKYKQRYGIVQMVWMGGEPLLRKDVLELGIKIFPQNTITTNGTLPLINLGPKIRWVVSLDGPKDINDEIRGKGCFDKVIDNLNNLPGDFQGDLQCNCVITKKNEKHLEEFINNLKEYTPLRGVNFTFYVPRRIDTTDLSWDSLEERDLAIRDLMNLKKNYPKFILNNLMVLDLMLSENAKNIVDDCPVKNYMLPLYLGEEGFERPFCCYGNDVNCDLCGAWAVFHLAALIKINPGWPIDAVRPFKNIKSFGISK